MKKILITLFLFLIMTLNVNAESKCSYTEQAELLNKASNVKVNYEIISTENIVNEELETIDYFRISVYNITEDFYINIKNDQGDNETFYYSDAVDGVISLKYDIIDKVSNFEIYVYSSTNTNCPSEKYKTLYLQTPRFNDYSNYQICQELKDFYLCKEYVTFGEMSKDDFRKQLESYKSGLITDTGEEIKELTFTDKIVEIIRDYKWFILGGIVIISGGVFMVHRKKTKKSRELGL